MESVSCQIMPLVIINSHGVDTQTHTHTDRHRERETHTHTHTHANTHTDDPHRFNFKKPAALA